MPLYTDSSGIYWATSSSATSSNRDQYSSYLPGAYVSYSRPLTYSLPSTSSLRPNYTASSSRYHPKLSTITETPYNSRGLTSLTRINSPKVHTTGTTSYHSSYIPLRPININTADIDVSEKRFKKHDDDNNYSLGSITTIEEKNETNSNTISESPSDFNKNNNKINEDDEQEQTIDNEITSHFVNRSTIKRNRAVVRLSISRPSNPYLNNKNENLLLAKKQKIEQVNGNDSNYTETVQPITSSADSSFSWRQKVGEDLLKPLKTNKKSPGDIMREKHFIPIVDPKDEAENENQLQKIDDYNVPDNLKPKEGEPTDLIVEINPLTHTAVRRLSIPRCPDFQDFCEDISSDKIDDDLNAGALRRRASLIQEQEIELLNQLQKSASGSVQLIHLERIENPSDLITSAKRKSKKKRIRHKITATVDVDNPLPLLKTEESTSSELSSLSGVDQQGTPSGSESPKKSPKITYHVDEIEENHTTVVKLPKKKKKVVEKKLETIENKDAFKNSPKKVKVIKKVVPSKGRNGKVEPMEEVLGEKPKQKEISDVSNKPNVAKQSEILPPKTPIKDLKSSNVLDTSSEKVGLKTPNSVPVSPLKKVKALQTTKSAAEISTINNILKTPSTPDYFKFDEESIAKAQKKNISSPTTKVETPKTLTGEKCKDSDKSSEAVKLRTKPKAAKKYERSDSGDDFWSSVGSRETIYFDRRKQSVLENLWNKRENLLDNEEMKDVSNLDSIKEKVSKQKNEELKEAADYIDPICQTENRRARSNEFELCDKSKNVKLEGQEKSQKTENVCDVKKEKSSENNLVDVNDKSLHKKITSPPQTPTVQSKIQTKNTAQQKSNNLPKISSDLDAKSPEIKTKMNQNKKDILVSKLSSDVAAKKTTDALTGTPASPSLNKFAANKKDSENDPAIKEKEKISKAQVAKTINDVKSSAFSEQGKDTIAKLNATNTDAKSKLLNKFDSDKNKSETKIGSSVQSPTETIASPSSSKDKLLTTTPLADNNKKQTTENVAKQSNTNINTKENKNLEKEKTTLSALSKNLPTTQKKIDDKDKTKTNIKTTTSSDDAIASGKTSFATNDVKNDNKVAKINTEIAPDAKNKSNATATTKTKTCDDKTTIKDTKKSDNINDTTATTTTTEKTTSDTTATAKLANNVSDDKSIDNGGSNNNNKNNLKSNSNLNDTELKTTATSKGAVGERASQQLSFKKVLNKTKEQKLEEIKKGGNLQKFDTLSNLNEFLFDVDADLKDYKENNSSDSNNSDSYNSSCKSDTSSMKRKDKKQKQKLAAQEPEPFNRNRVKLDHTKKLYVKDESANKYILVATPRPLWKPEKFAYNSDSSSEESDDETTDSDDDSECETSSSSDDSGGEEDELNPHHKKNCLIRLSTCSNDSGFVGGTAPTNPKKMLECDVSCHKKCEKLAANLCGVNQKLIVEALSSVRKGPHDARDSPSTPPSHNPAFKIESNYDADDETSYTYAQFQKTGRITAPATNIPRFKKYAVEDFHFLAVLGKGSFGKVLLAELRNSDYYYAVKCLKKDVVLEDDDVECTLIERKVLALGTKHPYLCHLFCTFQTESHLFFVMEYLNGGDLMFHIQQNGRFTEPRARFYGAEIVSGLKFLHKKGIIYRDLKLDNVLLDFEGHVRIADFGMCKLQIYLDKTADSFCGTPDYMAPEIIKGDDYNQNVDWWSFGVLLYEMLIGQSPFSGCDEEYLFWSICNEIPMYPMCLSQEATNLLKALLEKDSAKRIGSQYSPQGDILVHPFFVPIDWELLEKRQIEPPFKPQVKHPLDTKYFDKTFTRERVRLTPIDKEILHSMDQAQFQGFSYTNPNATMD